MYNFNAPISDDSFANLCLLQAFHAQKLGVAKLSLVKTIEIVLKEAARKVATKPMVTKIENTDIVAV